MTFFLWLSLILPPNSSRSSSSSSSAASANQPGALFVESYSLSWPHRLFIPSFTLATCTAMIGWTWRPEPRGMFLRLWYMLPLL